MTPEQSIAPARTPHEIGEMRVLFREYEAFLKVDLCFQDFEQELARLPGAYAPPSGALFMATVTGQIAGCVALRPLEGGACEMKRLFVRPRYRGLGLGRKLAKSIVLKAKRIGFERMKLDTFGFLDGAIHIYKDLGFREIDPYYNNPYDQVQYWELDLNSLDPPAVL